MIKKKLLTIVAGTRPNLIKIAPLIRVIKMNNFFDYRIVYTQQHKSKIMSKGDVLNFMQTYQRITQNMFRSMPKYASVIFNLNSNHQIKSAVYKKK